MNQLLSHLLKALECALLNHPLEELGVSGEDQEFIEGWGRQVANTLIQLCPELFVQTNCVLCSTAEVFSSIVRSRNSAWLLSDLLQKPHKFAHSLLLMIKFQALMEGHPLYVDICSEDKPACRSKVGCGSLSRMHH